MDGGERGSKGNVEKTATGNVIRVLDEGIDVHVTVHCDNLTFM